MSEELKEKANEVKTISIELIKKLKELSGVGLTDAKNALVEAKGDFDKALDILYSENWAIIRNPDPRGSVFFDFRGDRRPTKKQIDAAFTHIIKFNEPTLPGIEKYLED